MPTSQQTHLRVQRIASVFKIPPRALIRLGSLYFQPAPKKSKELHLRTFQEEIKDVSSFNIHVRSQSSNDKNNMLKVRRTQSDYSFIEKRCTICVENDCNGVLMECGHGGICYKCAEILLNSNEKCHMCRGIISYIVKIQIEPDKILKVIGVANNINES